MLVKLPIPILSNNINYVKVEIRKPSPGIIADTKKSADSGDKFSAICTFIEGVITKISSVDVDVEDRIAVKSLIKNMPYRSAELVMIKAMLLLDANDFIEGVYSCPRCGKQIICECKEENGETIFDTRDRISELEIRYTDVNKNFRFELSAPVDIMNGETLEERISTMEMTHPTMKDCISAYQKIGDTDEIRLQFAIFVESIKKVNEIEIDSKWRNRNSCIVQNLQTSLDLKNKWKKFVENAVKNLKS
jgi:hypothetical protein